MLSSAQKKLKKTILKDFRSLDNSDISTWRDIKKLHYNRNTQQPDDIDYADIIIGDYKLVSDAQSALHRFGAKHQNNSKWLSADGHEEFVFRYNDRDPAEAGFELVTTARNMGSYNFATTNDLTYFRDHVKFDINPWLFWGNTAKDAANWDFEARSAAYDPIAGAALEFYNFIIWDAKERGNRSDNDFSGQPGQTKFLGKGGNDTVSYQDSVSAVTVNLQKGKGFDGDARGDTFNSIENITGSQHNDILVGNGRSNILDGGAGDDEIFTLKNRADTLYGGDGDDVITIKAGYNHVVDGGSGYDIVDLRGLNLNRVNLKKFTNIEEIWVDDLLVTDTSAYAFKTVVFGTHTLNLRLGSKYDDGYLFGGAALEFREGASIKIDVKFDPILGLPENDFALVNEPERYLFNDPTPTGDGWSGWGTSARSYSITDTRLLFTRSAGFDVTNWFDGTSFSLDEGATAMAYLTEASSAVFYLTGFRGYDWPSNDTPYSHPRFTFPLVSDSFETDLALYFNPTSEVETLLSFGDTALEMELLLL